LKNTKIAVAGILAATKQRLKHTVLLLPEFFTPL